MDLPQIMSRVNVVVRGCTACRRSLLVGAGGGSVFPKPPKE